MPVEYFSTAENSWSNIISALYLLIINCLAFESAQGRRWERLTFLGYLWPIFSWAAVDPPFTRGAGYKTATAVFGAAPLKKELGGPQDRSEGLSRPDYRRSASGWKSAFGGRTPLAIATVRNSTEPTEKPAGWEKLWSHIKNKNLFSGKPPRWNITRCKKGLQENCLHEL